MKQIRNYLRCAVFLAVAAATLCAWSPRALGQANLPYSSGSTGADGSLTFRTIPVGGRYGHSMAYDAARNQTILFGGYNQSGNTYFNETWSFNGTNWTKLSPANSPSRRSASRMVYVPWNGGRIILFGGYDSVKGNVNDTWMWDGATWTEIDIVGRPPARSQHVMVYDAQRDKVMVFSGSGAGNDTWLFDGAAWTNPAFPNPSLPNSPPAWNLAIAAYDAERKQTVLISYNGTYTWDGVNWVSKTPVDPIPRVDSGGITFDPIRKEVLVFGGNNNPVTYAWNGTNWFNRNPTNHPVSYYNTEMVFDAARGRVTLSCGQAVNVDANNGDTWTWDGTKWTFVSGKNQYFDMSSRADGIWNYTSINIPAGVSVNFIKNAGNTPVRWLAQDFVQIDGNIVLDGAFGDNALPEGQGGASGPGGFDGGHGGIRLNRSGSYVGSPGQGPGGGLPGTQPSTDRDGKQGNFASGVASDYSNVYLQPLIGGSGGGGGASNDGSDGGNGAGGGGAILIASSRDIVINGGIYSRGGNVTYSGSSYGGRGSGGGILLRADRISGAGSVDATPNGRIRFEAYYRSLAGSTQPISVNSAPVVSNDLNTVGTLSIISVKGANVAQPPSGNTLNPDVIFTDAGPVAIVVQGSNVPNNTPVQLRITTATGIVTPPTQVINNNTVTFNVVVPKGIGTIQAFASFTVNN